ncbi:TOBE domain-containing protein [Teredinibacter haidensis]|uniref:TOBE domain-containing protein n=1 Tax=Teredinibacter haidensis TaxID=2731755 RepID=UPI000948A391|nr:TOBE domain-containing protein [Teredinibacter haidensis]
MNKSDSMLGAAKLSLHTEMGQFLNDHRIRLLDAIAVHGSLSAAARSLPMSYKAAWEALDSMNNLSARPIVIRSTGGKNGGGTQLTPYAHKLISLYKAMEIEYQKSLERLQEALEQTPEAKEVNDFRKLMNRVNFKTSARNQLVGTVTSVTIGAVNVIVELKISEQLTLVAAVTKDSAQSLGIEFGQELVALVKSSQMVLHQGDKLKLSANNQLKGVISRIQPGAVCSDISVELEDQKSLSVTITQESLEQLALKIEQPVTVCFNASAVILCRYS